MADSILGELQSGAEPDAVRERYAEGGGEETGIEVVVEELPPVSTKAGLETSPPSSSTSSSL